MSSDDGNQPKPPETSSGGEPLSATEFWKLVSGQSAAQPAEPSDPTAAADGVPDQPLGSALSLEERLAVAQSQGLGPNLRRQLAFVGAGESVFEFQALGVRRYANDSFDKTRAAHARGPEEAVALCASADDLVAHGVYVLPARLRPGVESRHAAPGHWYDIPKGGGTTDSDVEARLVLAIDFDVKRPSQISATEEEMQRSVRVALNAWRYLAHHLGESSLAYLHSGNGRQIHVALDAVPANEEAKVVTTGVLAGLAHLFNTPEVTVDEKLSDAKRILPACGTVKKKGATGVDDRPHRRTAIVTPETPTRVPLGKLVELARVIWEESSPDGRAAINKAFGVKPQASSVVTGIRDNPDSPFGLANSVDPQAVAEWLGLYNARGEVVCPGCGETSGVSVLNHGLKCHHNRCADRGKSGFRTNIDLVMEVHHLAAKEAVVAISERFGLNLHFRPEPPPQPTAASAPSSSTQSPSDPSSGAPTPAQTTEPFAYPPSRFLKISTTEIFKPLPPINWLVKDLHLVAGRPTLIAGYGFSGKTLIAQSAGIGLTSGANVWGKFAPAQAVTFWHLDYEQGSYATKRRYQRLALGHGVPRAALGERLQVTVFPDVYLDSPDAVDAYSRAVEGVSVVVLDALRGATPTMDENDSTIRRCLDNLTRISEQTGTAFLVLHHAGKSRDSETSDPRKIPRGSSAIFDACGCVFTIEGEKNEPKLVVQTKAPAEAEGMALADFFVSIEDVPDETGPTAGLRVSYQEGTVETEARLANARLTERKQRIMTTVASLPGELTSSTSILERVGGKKGSVLAAIKELFEAGLLAQPGGSGTPIVVGVPGSKPTGHATPSGTGSQRFPGEREPVPGSPPLKGGTGTSGGGAGTGEGTGGTAQANRDRERAVTTGVDSDELFGIQESGWRAYAAEKGWSRRRYDDARAIVRARVSKARADGQALHQVALRGEEPRAWATELGWDDERIRAGMRFVDGGTSEPRRTASEDPVNDVGSADQTEPERRSGEDPANEVTVSDPQAESDADALSCMKHGDRSAHMQGWVEERRALALAALKARESGIVKDANALQRESYRGTDVEAWAKGKGWSETRFRAAKIRMVW